MRSSSPSNLCLHSLGTEVRIIRTNRILIVMAIVILLIDFPINMYLLNYSPEQTGTFIAMILICVVLMRLIDEKRKNK
jgi:hypothetical protein